MRNGDTAGQSRRGGRQPSATGLPIDYIFRPNDPTAPLLHHRPPRPLSTHFPEFTRFYRFFFSLSLNRVCSIFTGIFFDRYELNDRYDRTAPRTVSPEVSIRCNDRPQSFGWPSLLSGFRGSELVFLCAVRCVLPGLDPTEPNCCCWVFFCGAIKRVSCLTEKGVYRQLLVYQSIIFSSRTIWQVRFRWLLFFSSPSIASAFLFFFCLDIFFWFLRGLRPNTVAGNPSIIRRSDSRVDASVHYLFSVIRKKKKKKK